MITVSEYSLITNYLGQVEDESANAIASLSSMTSNLENNEVFSRNNDKQNLLEAISETSGKEDIRQNRAPFVMITFVRSLHTHVEAQYGQLINDFLSANGIKVSPSFANLSSQASYPINQGNIV